MFKNRGLTHLAVNQAFASSNLITRPKQECNLRKRGFFCSVLQTKKRNYLAPRFINNYLFTTYNQCFL